MSSHPRQPHSLPTQKPPSHSQAPPFPQPAAPSPYSIHSPPRSSQTPTASPSAPPANYIPIRTPRSQQSKARLRLSCDASPYTHPTSHSLPDPDPSFVDRAQSYLASHSDPRKPPLNTSAVHPRFLRRSHSPYNHTPYHYPPQTPLTDGPHSPYRYHTLPTKPPDTPTTPRNDSCETLASPRYSMKTGRLEDDSPYRPSRNARHSHKHSSSHSRSHSKSGSIMQDSQPQNTPVGGDSTGGRDSDDARSDTVRSCSSPFSSAKHYFSPPRTPLPRRRLIVLGLLCFSEQAALNSIVPYLPAMVGSLEGVAPEDVGVYIGLIASAFALAQLSSNFFWGRMSDRVGRKPVLVAGTFFLCICFVLFGLCRSFYQVLLVHAAMGLLNGNGAIIPTIIGELTDRSNQGVAFGALPMVYSLGSIVGPAVGGLLVGRVKSFPFLLPNIVSAVILAISVLASTFFLRETLEVPKHAASPPWGPWKWWTGREAADHPEPADHATSETPLLTDRLRRSYTDGGGHHRQSQPSQGDPPSSAATSWKSLLRDPTTATVLGCAFLFQMVNIAFPCLYPVFAASPEPTGRALAPVPIGLSMSVASMASIAFQASLFARIQTELGNRRTFRWSLVGLAVGMFVMPWVGHKSDRVPWGFAWTGVSAEAWMYVEMGVVLVLLNISSCSGFSSVMMLVNHCAPSNDSLGTLNGISQSLTSVARSLAPLLSGGLFAVATRHQPKGELLAWGVFGAVAVLGGVCTLVLNGRLVSADRADPQEDMASSDEEIAQPEVRQRPRLDYDNYASDPE